MGAASLCAAAAGRAVHGRALSPCLDQKIARLYHGTFHAVAAGGKNLPPPPADPVTEPWSRSTAAAAKMNAQAPPVFTRWPEPQSPASREAAPAAPTGLCVIARRCLLMDRRGVRQLARRGASWCLSRTTSSTAAGEAAARRERVLVMRCAYARAPVSAVCGSGEPQESHNGLEGLCHRGPRVERNGMYAVSRFSPRYIVEVKMQLQPFRLHARLRTAAGNL